MLKTGICHTEKGSIMKNALRRIIAAGAAVIAVSAVSLTAYAAPSAYSSVDNGYITSVKNQGSWGVCWAFAATSASESSLIKEFPEKFSSQTTDLSENLLAYMTSHPAVYGHPGMSADIGKYTADTNTYYLSAGGNSQFVGFAYMNGYGPYAESDKFPYSAYGTPTIADYDFTEAEYYELRDSGIAKATGMLTATLTKTADNDNVKQMIMDYGSVVIGYCDRKSECLSSDSSGNYYYYCPDSYTQNHDVTIVGWDDSIPASAFKTAPEGNGAWLIKNSWGSSSRDGGYFWLSYYDKSLEDKVAAFDFTIEGEDDYYDKCYSYDGANNFKRSYVAGLDTIYSSNIFTAEEDLIVNGAAFYTAEGNVLEVSVYTDLTSDTSPTSGTKAATKAVNAKYGGYISCTFDSEVKVAKGEKFSIVLKNTAPGGTGYAYLEAATSTAMLGDTYTVSVLEGESFISTSGSSWSDCYSRGGNVLIKAFVVNEECGHSFGSWITDTAATCTAAGSKHRVCSKCGYKETGTIAATGHSYGTWTTTKAATCTATGTETRKCSCGASETKTVSALGHSYSAKVVAPTCTEQGYTLHTCSRCSTSYKDTNTSAKGHSYGAWTTTKAATCTATGTQTRKCSCGAYETKTISALGHNYVTSVVKPTYTAKGYTLHKCSRCGNSYKDTYTAKLVVPTVSGLKCSSKTNVAVTLRWTKNSVADGYIIDRYDSANSKWVTVKKITSNATTSYKVTGLRASTTNKFRIKAYKSTASSKFTYLNVNTRPYTTTGLSVSSKTNVAITLKWNKNISADGYVLDKYDGTKWVTVKKITSNATTSYTVTGLKASTTYKFRLKAYKMYGTAYESSAFSYINVNTRPYTTTGFKISSTTKTSIKMQWNKNISASGYCIEKWDGSKWVQIKRFTSNANVSYTVVSGLKANTSYKFRMRAYKTIGTVNEYSAYTQTLTAKTKA